MIKELLQYGLSEREAETYITCLKLGQATANRIASMRSLPRSTVYDILERLKSMGLITTVMIDNKTQFVASDPDALMISLEEKKKAVRDIISELKMMHKRVGERPKAEVFQGKIAIIKLFDEMLDNAKSLKVLGSQGNAIEKIGYHPDRFRMKRIERKIRIRQILEESPEARKEVGMGESEVRFVDSFANSREAIFMFDDYVYHIILQYEISAIKIKSADHANSMGIIFEELWKNAKE